MTRVTVLGGTGYAGANIAHEAQELGLSVTVFSRSEPAAPLPGVAYELGNATDAGVVQRIVEGADVVVSALSPRGAMAGRVGATVQALAGAAAKRGVRLIVVGGFGSLRPAPGEPRMATAEDIPEAFRAESREMAGIVDWLQSPDAPAGLDWLFVSPAENFGSYAPGTRTGHFHFAGEVVDVPGSSISGADFGLGIAQEIAHPAHAGHVLLRGE
ncbi:MAG: NAD(P)H-binding protein [Microbacteriaceae bacterium]|jgi:putative NADH-flavin reductase|nr:NAD(P)H-binding protein [Microbacteriaceae bacterium]MCI1207220.1 NAD(P)H-binding protein [Microbacteriaceae bacterium]